VNGYDEALVSARPREVDYLGGSHALLWHLAEDPRLGQAADSVLCAAQQRTALANSDFNHRGNTHRD
jgi:hypothetical protein